MKSLCLFALSLATFLSGQVQPGVNTLNLKEGLVSVWQGPLELHGEQVLDGVASPENSSSESMTLSLILSGQNAAQGTGVSQLIRASGLEGMQGWSLWLNAKRQPVFELQDERGTIMHAMKSPEALRLDISHHIAVVIKRDLRQALSGLWVDGIEVASIAVPAGKSVLWPSDLRAGSSGRKETLEDLRLYNRSLTRAEIFELALRVQSSDMHRAQEFGASLDFMEGEVLAVVGGSEAVAMMEDGRFEANLLASTAGKRLRVRDLSWEADTVFRQDRPMNFGGLEQQLRRVAATSVLLLFGRQECLEGKNRGDFLARLTELITRCKAHTPRIILAEPLPYGPPRLQAQPDLRMRNTALSEYALDMKQLAKDQGIHWASAPKDKSDYTKDGLQLNSAGSLLAGQGVLDAMSSRQKEVTYPKEFVQLVREKHQLWHDYWRPSNWAFLHGDRTSQPSSRDHLNPSVRWFPAELERYQQRIAATEKKLDQLISTEPIVP